MLVKGGSSEKFRKNLKELINIDRKDTIKEILVINAWNEWGKGAFLELSEEDKFAYLEAIGQCTMEGKI